MHCLLQILCSAIFCVTPAIHAENFNMQKWFTGHPESPYELSWFVDPSLLAGGYAFNKLGEEYAPSNVKVYTVNDVTGNRFSAADINVLERFAVGPYSKQLDAWSDYSNNLIFCYPLLLLTAKKPRHDIIKISVMFFEVTQLYPIATIWSKPVFARKRPYFYSKEETAAKKITPDAQSSFISGHANFAFAFAAFTGTLFGDYYPESKWKTTVWSVALGSAGVTSILKLLSHEHYPTDVLAGAVTGALAGWGVPYLHRNSKKHAVGVEPIVGEYVGVKLRTRIGLL